MTSTIASPPQPLKPVPVSRPAIPPLENGDRLTREEFERRYDAMPALKKAELIEGVVYMPALRHREHGAPHFKLVTWLGRYCEATPGIDGGDNTTLRLDLDNDPQPDACLRIEPVCGGQSHIDNDGYVTEAPELIAEVAASSVSYDLHDKLHVYGRNGVREYVVWRVLDQEIDWFVLKQSRYERLSLHPSGSYRSEVFPGLWLDPIALVQGDVVKVSQVLQQGLASPEHAAFVAKLHAALPQKPT